MLTLFDRVWRRRWLGILACAVALGPAIVMYAAILRGVHAGSFYAFADYLLALNPVKVLRGWSIVAASSVPVLLIYAYVMRRIRRVTGDFVLAAMLCGAVIPPATLAIVAAVSKIDLTRQETIEVLVTSIIGTAIGALYWLLVIRFERRADHVREQAARGIAAMD